MFPDQEGHTHKCFSHASFHRKLLEDALPKNEGEGTRQRKT